MEPSEARIRHETIMARLDKPITEGVGTLFIMDKVLDEMSHLVMEMINDMENE
jgi:hypothetical protein